MLGFIVCPLVFIALLRVSGAEQAAAPRRTGRAAVELGPGYVVARSVAVQADGRIVAAGTHSNGRKNTFAVVRFTGDGLLDPTFNGNGFLTTAPGEGEGGGVSGLVIQADGKIVVAGTIAPKGATRVHRVPSVFSIVRFTASGQLDPGFGDSGAVLTQVSRNELSFASALAIQPDGKIVMAGSASTSHWWPVPMSRYDFAVVRYLPDGQLDATFGRRGVVVEAVGHTSEDSAQAIALQSDGGILVAGYTHVRYEPDIGMLRLRPDGTRDPSFGNRSRVITKWKTGNMASGVAVQADGKILVVGLGVLVRYLPDGRLESSFGNEGFVKTPVDGGVIVLQPDGKVLLADARSIVRCLPDGRLDPDFGRSGIVTQMVTTRNGVMTALAIQRDGRILVAGSTGGQSRLTVVRYNADGSLDTSFGEPASARCPCPLLRQRDDRVDARRADRGQCGCDDGHEHQQSRHGHEHDGIGGSHAEQLALQALPKRERAQASERKAAADEQQALTQHELTDRGRAAAKCDADADLPPPLRDEIRQDAVDTERRKKQRHGAENQ